MKSIINLIRALHLYFGLFISPFVMVFSISVLVFNHSGLINKLNPVRVLPLISKKLDHIPYDSTDLGTAKNIMKEIDIEGEVDYVAKNKNTILIPVNKPGLKTRIEADTLTKNVLVTQQNEGSLRGMGYLHIMPGQHNAKIRGNSLFIKIWRQAADVTVYLIFFLTASGIFLWYFLKPERKTGLYFLGLGFFIFLGLSFLIY